MPNLKTILTAAILVTASVIQGQDMALFDFQNGWTVIPDNWKFKAGDDPSWANPAWDDAQWDEVTLEQARAAEKNLFWIRTEIQLTGDQHEAYPLAVGIFNMPMAYELFWDGKHIGSGGTVGETKSQEIPGPVRRLIRLNPAMTAPGLHHVALRISAHRTVHPSLYGDVHIGYFHGIQIHIHRNLNEALIYVGLYFIATLLCILLYSGGWRQPSFLIFSAYTGFNIVINGWIYFIESQALSVNLFQWLEPLFYIGATGSLMLLALFLIWYFEIPNRRFHAIGFIVFFIIMHGWPFGDDVRELLIGFICFSYAALIAAWRWKQRQPGAAIAYSGIGLLLLHQIYEVIDCFIVDLPSHAVTSHFFINVLFVSLIIGSISLRILDHYRQYQLVKVEAQRLEKELEKQNTESPYLVCRRGKENHLLPVSTIVYFKAARVLVEAHLINGDFELLEKPLNQLEDLLPNHFIRTHRSYIVNIHHIKSYRHSGGGVYHAVLKDDTVVPISRYRLRTIRKRISS